MEEKHVIVEMRNLVMDEELQIAIVNLSTALDPGMSILFVNEKNGALLQIKSVTTLGDVHYD